MLAITPLAPADRADWERLFRGYIAFYERDEPQAMYDRAWAAFMAGDRLHALGARLSSPAAEAPYRSSRSDESLAPKGGENRAGSLVGITHFFVHPSTSGPDVCYLQDLFTDQAARGQGAGRALIAAVADWARGQGCGRLYWLTHESNATARALYDKVAVNRGFIRYDIALG
jgi:GNAT superfamily N-acetyltransferase